MFCCCFTDALAKSLSDLMALVKLLREDVAHQRQEIAYLRLLLENCAGCKEPKGDNNIHTCRTSNPCYPGKFKQTIKVLCLEVGENTHTKTCSIQRNCWEIFSHIIFQKKSVGVVLFVSKLIN